MSGAFRANRAGTDATGEGEDALRPEVRRLTPTAAECVVTGAPADFQGALEVWLDGASLPDDQVLCERVGLGLSAAYLLRTPGRSLFELARAGARVRIAGAEVEAPFPPLQPRLTVQGSDCVLEFGPAVVLPNGYALAVSLADASGAALGQAAVVVRDGVGRFSLPAGVSAAEAEATVQAADGEILGAGLRLRRGAAPRLSSNGDFARWAVDGPTGWRMLAGEARRGAYAFSLEVRDRRGLSGSTLAARVEDQAFSPILEQTIPAPRRDGEGEAVTLSLFGRASRLTEVELALFDGERMVAATRAVCDGDWSLRQAAAPIPAAVGGETLTFRVSARALTAEAGYLELAGLGCGVEADGRFDDPTPPAIEPGVNLLVNGALQHWPNGISGRETRTHFETAEGWWFYKHQTDAPAYFAAVPAPDPSARLPEWGLSISAPVVPDGCRLEAKLKPVRLDGRFQLTFTARAGDVGESPGDHHLLDRQWLYIGQITVFRRSIRRLGQATHEFETPVAVIARQVLLSRQWRTFAFGFAVEPQTLHVEDGEHVATEYFLGFAVRQSLAMQIRGVRLEAADQALEAPPPPVQLEDTRILAQVGLIRGVEAWLAPEALKAAPESSEIATPAATPRWRWAEPRGSIEIAVCVHNATEDVLACLASLARRTTAPHTVHIVDDGSDEDCRARLEAFLEGKPWMRLTRNPRNLGYTASANRAVLGSAADWVVLLNSDTQVSDGWLEGLLEVAAADPRIAMVGPVSNAATYQSVPELYDGAGRWMVNGLPPGWSVQDMADAVREVSLHAFPDTPLLNGFCTLIRRSVFEEIGGFDEAAFPQGYGEENDLCLRAAKAGYRLCVADHVYVHHAKSASFGAERRAELTAQGDRALRAMHPEVDFRALGRQFLETPAMALLREALRRKLRAAGR